MSNEEYLIIGKAVVWKCERGYVDLGEEFDDIKNLVSEYKKSKEYKEKG